MQYKVITVLWDKLEETLNEWGKNKWEPIHINNRDQSRMGRVRQVATITFRKPG